MSMTSSPAVRLFAGPSAEPVSAGLVKAAAAIDADLTVWDEAIAIAIASARRDAEHRTGRKLITQVWDVVMDAFPAKEVHLPLAPIASVQLVTYLDQSGAQQVLPSSSYVLDTARDASAWLLPADGVQWPVTHGGANSVIIRCVVGYGGPDAVPPEVRQWIALKAASSLPQSDLQMSDYVDSLLDGLRLYGT